MNKPLAAERKTQIELEIRISSIAPFARLLDLILKDKDHNQPELTAEEQQEVNRLYEWWSNLDEHNHHQIRQWAQDHSYHCEDATRRIKRIYSSEREKTTI